MSDAKQPWTEGEWRLFGRVIRPVVEGRPAENIAEVRIPVGSRQSSAKLLVAEFQANGRLIAQAPAMAEALAEFVFGYELAWRSSGRKGTYTEPPVIARARAVLDAAGWRWS